MRVGPADRMIRPEKVALRRRSKKGSKGLLKRLVRILFLAVLFVFLLSLIAVVPLRWLNPPTTAFMLADATPRSGAGRGWVRWADMGESLPLAVIASEDQKFADHWGVDIGSIRMSVVQHADGAPLRGASTITQQVAKNLYLWRGRSYLRKGLEACLALLIEVTWSKQRILEVYLNIAEFGPGIYGAGQAATVFFAKPPQQLRDAEGALLAAVLPNPNRLHAGRPSDYVRERQAWIIGQMQRLRTEQWLLRLQSAR